MKQSKTEMNRLAPHAGTLLWLTFSLRLIRSVCAIRREDRSRKRLDANSLRRLGPKNGRLIWIEDWVATGWSNGLARPKYVQARGRREQCSTSAIRGCHESARGPL